jgi:hypothetical protein
MLVFVVLLGLTVPAVGAFNNRIYSTADLAARGLPVFGAIPRFPGDDVGAFRERANGSGA